MFQPMSIFDLKQTDRAELLDLHQGSLAEVRASLHDIRRINAYLGGSKVIGDAVFSLLETHDLRRATVLDIGTGSADIPIYLAKKARQKNIELRVIALDINARHLKIAREDLSKAHENAIELLEADAFSLPFPSAEAEKGEIDIVVSSLFLHHFRAPQIQQLLAEFDRVSRVGFVMNDLVRHNLPLWFFRLTRPIFARSYITRHDGEASLRRAYTTAEMREIVRESSISKAASEAVVCEHFPFRFSVIHDKNRFVSRR